MSRKSINRKPHYFLSPMAEAAKGRPSTNIKPQLSEDPAYQVALAAFLAQQADQQRAQAIEGVTK
jgi:hypothetical protein